MNATVLFKWRKIPIREGEGGNYSRNSQTRGYAYFLHALHPHWRLTRRARSITQSYPDYYQMIAQPIAMSHLRKRAQTNYYKDVQQYRDEWRLLFNNARTYNVEGSMVYNDADEMEKILDDVFGRMTKGTDLPGAAPGGSGSGAASSARTPGEDEDKPLPSRRVLVGRTNSKQILSDDDEYLTPSDEE